MSQLGLLMLQESVGGDREATATTILGLFLLRGQMDGVVDARSMRRRRTRTSLKERFGFKGFGCCGATWGSIRDDDDFEGEGPPSPLPLPLPEEEEAIILEDVQEVTDIDEAPARRGSDPGCLELGPAPIPASSGMNLAAALAAERQFREVNSMLARTNGSTNGGDTEMSPAEPGTPWRVSLMRLLEETDGVHGGIGRCDEKEEAEEEEEEKGGGDRACCVCMGRKKGAAFIPCGHTFCRVCSREIWLNRGSCPLCNRSILEILDIF